MSRRIADTIRGYRIQAVRPVLKPREYRAGYASPEDRARLEAQRKADNAWALKHGLALVMMQERELDENGHREQTDELPNWRAVEKMAASTDGGD